MGWDRGSVGLGHRRVTVLGELVTQPLRGALSAQSPVTFLLSGVWRVSDQGVLFDLCSPLTVNKTIPT